MNSLLFPWEEEKLPPPSSLVVTFFIWLGVGFLLDYCISKTKKLHRESQTNIRAVEYSPTGSRTRRFYKTH
ncbi:hypothetical protein CFP56_007234 [Quercus suber]|uniref:ATP synthase F0 subunit 8 n=1 Tax=Quercus suber TaxID=58331 RepID=A0AAW0L954_QUESU